MKALPEIEDFLKSLDLLDVQENPEICMYSFMMKIIDLNKKIIMNIDIENDEDKNLWKFIKENLLYDNNDKHIPIPVYSYVKPTMGPRFILHIMLSMGEFDTELDFLLHPTLRESLRYCNLIGPLEDEVSLQNYSYQLQKRYIQEQLQYFPNSRNILDRWIITACDFFDGIIIRNEMPIVDLPPAHLTSLNESKDQEVIQSLLDMKDRILHSSFREMASSLEMYNLPIMDEIRV